MKSLINWVWIIAGIFAGLLVLVFFFQHLYLTSKTMQTKKSLEKFENLASKLNDFCLKIAGNEEPLKFEVDEETVAIYATNSKYEKYEESELERFVKEGMESEGKFLCLKLKDRKLNCKELNCKVSMPFLGYLSEKFSLSSLINKLMGKTSITTFNLILKKEVDKIKIEKR